MPAPYLAQGPSPSLGLGPSLGPKPQPKALAPASAVLAQAALAYARFVDEEKRAEEVDGVLDLKPKRERKQSGKITRWTEAEEAPPCLTLTLALALALTLTLIIS